VRVDSFRLGPVKVRVEDLGRDCLGKGLGFRLGFRVGFLISRPLIGISIPLIAILLETSAAVIPSRLL
jgi:hypothetical protein